MKYRVAFVLVVSFVLLATIVFGVACHHRAPAKAIDVSAHRSEIQKWQGDRLASLTKEDGWLTLVGLFWLNEGENPFGSNSKNAVVLPQDKAAPVVGSFSLEKGHVTLSTLPGNKTRISVVPPAKGAMSYTDEFNVLNLKDDTDADGPTIVKIGSLLINVVKRGDRFGVRVKDSESRTRREFKGLDYFPIDPKWRIEARFEPYQPPKTILITNVLSMTEDSTSPGALVFEVDDKTYRLDPILEQGETDWFVMIADQTTGKETYGAGRYLYVSPADASGRVVIDFNRAYSPPCAFTNFATCPLPPSQNRLPFRIEAGEKKYAGTVH